jgi:lauroyl/myristoyl acyltransferase
VALAGYKGTSWLLGVLPEGPARELIGRLSQASYLAWPAKRRWSNQNFGHVLGLPPDDRRVRRLALRAYREYGRYLVELMRLPTMSRDAVGLLASDMDVDEIKRIWREASGGGLIFAVGHVGNNEAVRRRCHRSTTARRGHTGRAVGRSWPSTWAGRGRGSAWRDRW